MFFRNTNTHFPVYGENEKYKIARIIIMKMKNTVYNGIVI